jgi:glycosyltransferase involved in cell wall biosynthesis
MDSITFLFPGFGNYPIGGLKVIYEQANRLSNDNFKVNLVYPCITFFHKRKFKSKVNAIKRYIQGKLFGVFDSSKWFDLNINIKSVCVWSLNEKNIPASRYYCATGIQTAVYLNDYKNISPEYKLYYIQDFENWEFTDEEVLETYSYKMKKIVISDWLYNLVYKYDNNVTKIYNGFDFNYFKLINPINDRKSYKIALLYHRDERKRCKDGIKVIEKVKQIIPELEVDIFGVPKRDNIIPTWCHYYQQPNKQVHNEIYNNAAIFMSTSRIEGFALPPGEAMICGCTLVCTDISGFNAYAIKDKTALISKVYDIDTMASNIIFLIKNNAKRIELAKNGNEFIKKFTWESSYSIFKNIILYSGISKE